MSGVPEAEITAHDFVMVRAALVQRLGGANEALVWTRIHFRCADGAHRHVDSDEVAWWPASNEHIGAEVGMSADQVKRATAKLVADGYLVSAEHRLGGNYDRTKSWRPVVEPRRVESAESPNGEGDSADMSGRNRRQEQAISPNAPLFQTEKKEEDTYTVGEAFEEAWAAWPRKVSKAAARKKFERLAKGGADLRSLVAAIASHGDAYGRYIEPRFVPHLTTWLNGERWEDDLPGPSRGRGDERLAESVDLVRRLREEENGHAGIGSGAAAALGSGR